VVKWSVGFVVLCALGCSPTAYRRQADAETYPLIAHRATWPGTSIGERGLEAAPTSRLSEPYTPDCVPKPPDDPTAAFYMSRPGNLRGADWEKYGNAPFIDDPNWVNGLGLDSTGTLKLTQDRAVEIALANSREYQTNVEQVYLNALSLTLNRFDFATQWFAGQALNYTRVGASSLPDESNALALPGTIGFRRNLAGGGQLLVNFANSFVWEFTGGTQSVTGNLGGTLIQPLLRNFGRFVRLESLTQAERDTLYAVRDFARFRKQFWSNTAVDGGGYLNILLLIQNLRNARENLRAVEENYIQSLDLYRNGKLSDADVDRNFQSLLSARQQILNSELSVQSALDGFKLILGLPPRLPVDLDDSFLAPFSLTSRELEQLQDDLLEFSRARKRELDAVPEAETIRTAFDRLGALTEVAIAGVRDVEKDLAAWKAINNRPPGPDDDAETRQRSSTAYATQEVLERKTREQLGTLRDKLKLHAARLTGATRPESWNTLIADTRTLVTLVDDLVTAQNLARIYRIDLEPVTITEADAIAQAKANRLDLMNALARVTDTWRRVLVAANQLQSDLTVTGSYNLITKPGTSNVLDFSNQASRLSLGVQFDGPLNRQAERNNYRAAQIAHQVARRAYMGLNDTIEFQIRENLRGLRQARVSFEINRQSVLTNARQLASERALLSAPVQPRNAANRDATLATLQALANLNAARNSLVAFYIAYQQQRIRLLLNLEELQLDTRGFPTNAIAAVNASPDKPGTPAGEPLTAPRPLPVR